MPADVEMLMYAGTVPWHGLGKMVENDVLAEEAIKLAGLDWDVETAKIITNDQKKTPADEWRLTRRVTDEAILGVVPKKYVPIQNREAFKLMDAVAGGVEKKARYHTAGSLQGGAKVWMLVKLPEVMEIGPTKDPVERYILLSNSHDGSRPLEMLFTPVRVVCSNTLNMALHARGSDGDLTLVGSPRVAVRHNRNKDIMMKESERLMKKAHDYYSKFGDFNGYLASTQLKAEQVENIIAEVFPPNKQKIVTDTVALHRFEVERLFVEGDGHEEIAGSAWALLNAFGQYADHGHAIRRSKEVEDRSYSIWMGGAAALKGRATRTIAQAVM